MLEQVIKTFFTIVIVEFISIKTNYNTDIMAKGAMLASTLATIFCFLYTIRDYIKIEKEDYRQIGYKTKEFEQNIKEILSEIFVIAVPLCLTSFLMILESNIDSITIVKLLKDKIGEGAAREKYGIITSKVNLLSSLPMALNGAVAVALIPEISKSIVIQDKQSLKQSVDFSFLITLFIAVPIMLGLIVYCEDIMNFLYPNANKGAELLKLGSITIVFTSLSQTISGILQGTGDAKTHLTAICIGMILKLILNFVFIPIPLLLEKGAVLSSAICDFLIFMIMYVKLKDKINLKLNILYNAIKIFVISIISILFSKLVMSNIILNFRLKFVIEILIVVIMYIVLSIKFTIIDVKRVSNYLNFRKKEKNF